MRKGGFIQRRAAIPIAAVLTVLLVSGGTACAADYFAGRTIRIVVGFGPGSAYGLYGQLAAHHLTRFIPGNPSVVVSYMTGASGLTSMNYLYGVAPRDGTVLGMPMQDLASQQAVGAKGVNYDAARFNYLARASANVPVHMVWHTSPAQSISDLKQHEVITGSSSPTGTQADMPRAQNALLGTKWKIVGGYQDATRLVAMERGEIHAAVAAATLFQTQLKPWLANGSVKVVVQYADFRHPLFPEVPTIVELADTAEAKGVFRLLVSLAAVGRAYMAPPDVPAERIATLRKGFVSMFADPAFRADAEQRGADLLPISGEELAAHIKDVLATPASIVQKTNEAIGAE